MSRNQIGVRFAALLVSLTACALSAGAAPADLIIETELVPEQVYVGGEARLRLRLLRAPGVTHGILRAPALGEAGDMSLLGPIEIYQVERAGVIYEVLERRHVIVPRRAGPLVVPGAEFEGALRYAEVLNRDSRAPPTAIAPRTARGPQRVLEVRAIPSGASDPWLPARQLTLEESWSRDLDGLSAGTPVTRTLVLSAEGISAELLPRLEMAAQPGLLVHYDRSESSTEFLAEGMKARRVQRIVLMAVAQAEVTLPALSVHWWDVGADRPRTETLAGRTLTLHAAIAPPAVPREAPVNSSVPPMLRSGLALLALLFSLTGWWFWRTRPLREARAHLRLACDRNDPRAAQKALIEWSKLVMPQNQPFLLQGIGAAWSDAGAHAQVDALDAALYAGRSWDGSAFWSCVGPRLRGTAVRRPAFETQALSPLFRLHAQGAIAASVPARRGGRLQGIRR